MFHFIDSKKRLFVLNNFILMLLYSQLAWSGLGEYEDSIQKDQHSILAVRHHTLRKSIYRIHEISNSSLRVREFISDRGIIFGVSWKGSHHPDLTELLGKYFAEFQQASLHSRKLPGRYSHRLISSTNLVVIKSGHMRAVEGKAYVPGLVPQGMDINDIQ